MAGVSVEAPAILFWKRERQKGEDVVKCLPGQLGLPGIKQIGVIT
jgi:hypothetical protein